MSTWMTIEMQQLLASHRAPVVQPATAGQVSPSGAVKRNEEPTGVEFARLLQSRMTEVRFSAHAATRMKSRNIELTRAMMGKLTKAVAGAAEKGARDSLILLKNYAFIVNIPNRTVVTAMDGDGLKENVFTNIDSAVIAD
ncbi:MAG: hypothetical protein JW913_05990 [Chitinispirillaceae bacterium]|nr:hypothetical protein [Chitinispirillaceae bacterium]